MSEVKTYEIGGTTYEQRELVLGQWKQLRRLIDGIELPPSGSVLASLITALEAEGKLESALAVLLTEQGSSPRDKDLAATAVAMEFAVTPAQIAEVIDDFFDCNPASSILSQLGKSLVRLAALLAEGMKLIGSSPTASFCPAETSPEETPSSGDAPPPNAPPGSSTESAS